MKPKALGAWNLHAAVEGVETLEHFVCFSSVVGTMGNIGALGYSLLQTTTRIRLCAHLRAPMLLLPVSSCKP